MHQSKARYKVGTGTGTGGRVAERADPEIAVGFEVGQVVADWHSIVLSISAPVALLGVLKL